MDTKAFSSVVFTALCTSVKGSRLSARTLDFGPVMADGLVTHLSRPVVSDVIYRLVGKLGNGVTSAKSLCLMFSYCIVFYISTKNFDFWMVCAAESFESSKL